MGFLEFFVKYRSTKQLPLHLHIIVVVATMITTTVVSTVRAIIPQSGNSKGYTSFIAFHLSFNSGKVTSVISGNFSEISCNSVSDKFVIVRPYMTVKSSIVEYFRLVKRVANLMVWVEAEFPMLTCKLFFGVINMLLVIASQPGFNSITCRVNCSLV